MSNSPQRNPLVPFPITSVTSINACSCWVTFLSGSPGCRGHGGPGPVHGGSLDGGCHWGGRTNEWQLGFNITLHWCHC
jgi:hypothetical protein